MLGWDRYDWVVLAVGWTVMLVIIAVFDLGWILSGLMGGVIGFFSHWPARWLRNRSGG